MTNLIFSRYGSYNIQNVSFLNKVSSDCGGHLAAILTKLSDLVESPFWFICS